MVEKEKRLKVSELIADFFSGRITNFEYEDRFPTSKTDAVIHAVHTLLWFSYSDLREHRFDSRKLTSDHDDLLDRIRLFMRSDCEYVGPRSFLDPAAVPKRIWYWITRRPRPSISDWWPFETEKQLQEARLRQLSD